MTTKKVLITGISGFVGPYLAKQLLDKGHQVTGLITLRSDSQQPRRLIETGLVRQVQLLCGDVTNLSSVLSVIYQSQPDWIFHLAAQSFVPESFNDPLGTFRTNCLGTQNILESVRLRDIPARVIFA
jgi:GDPmannose 4,6-dehydratase